MNGPILSHSPEKTRELGERLAKSLRPGDVLALTGEIGSGKTTFVQGLAQGLGIPSENVLSPSFVLVREHEGRLPLYHADLFRLERLPEAATVGLEEYYDMGGVTVIEWANRIPELLPASHLEIRFEILDDQTRELALLPHGGSPEDRFRSWP